MPVRIKLSKAGVRVETRELVFNEDLISIGREASNTLPLVDPSVSKAHARMTRRGSVCHIVDLLSTNSTYLNGLKLAGGQEYPLHKGDKVRIAVFELELMEISSDLPLRLAHESSPATGLTTEGLAEDAAGMPQVLTPEARAVAGRTPSQDTPAGADRQGQVPSPAEVSEFALEAKDARGNPIQGVEAGSSLGESPDPSGGAESVAEVMPAGERSLRVDNAGFSLAQWSELKQEIARRLEAFDVREIASRQERLLARCEELTEENRILKEQIAGREAEPREQGPVIKPAELKRRPEGDPLGMGESSGAGPSVRTGEGGASMNPADAPRMERLLNALLQMVLKLSSGQHSFLSEFLARTLFQTSGRIAGRFQSGEEAISYLADPSLGEGEFAARLADLEGTNRQIILHVMGLLEGYRKSVDDGARRLLAQIDPESISREQAGTSMTVGPLHIPYSSLPVLLHLRVFKVLRLRHQELVQEDRGLLEKRFFRPGFVHGYEECVSAAARGAEGISGIPVRRATATGNESPARNDGAGSIKR